MPAEEFFNRMTIVGIAVAAVLGAVYLGFLVGAAVGLWPGEGACG